jgi:hypothetical protein
MTWQRACVDTFPAHLLSCVGWLSVALSVALEQTPYSTIVCVTSEANCGQDDQSLGLKSNQLSVRIVLQKSSGLIIDAGKGWRVRKIASEKRGRGVVVDELRRERTLAACGWPCFAKEDRWLQSGLKLSCLKKL